MGDALLEVKDLRTYFFTGGNIVRAVDGISYSVNKRDFIAIIGESGSGKSVSALSLLRLVPFPPGKIVGGQVLFKGEDLLTCSEERIRDVRGKEISMIFQEPSSALNPVQTIGTQISEALLLHNQMNDENLSEAEKEKYKNMSLKQRAMSKAVDLLRLVEIPNAETRVKDYPFQLSGGMQQRAMIAMAISCNPELLIADEPTTALDVTIQAQVLEELNKLRNQFGMAIIFITHNLGIVARYADQVKIMYGGRIVEEGTPEEIFAEAKHPYTIGLIRCVPRLDLPRSYGLHSIEGEPPNMAMMPPNCCPFYTRCKYADERCKKEMPPTERISSTHQCACFHQNDTKEELEEVTDV